MTFRMKIKRILKIEKPELQALIRPSPYLNLMVQQIISFQDENGSWFNNVYLTSKVTLALYEYYNFSGKIEYDVLNRSINYLKNQLMNLTEEILSLEDLYPRLDQTILNYSSILVTLYVLNQLDLDERVILAFEKLEKEAVKYVDSLSDIKIVSELVLVYKIKNLKIKPNEKLLRYLINKIYLRKSLDAAITIITIYQEYSQFLDGIWNKLKRSYTNEEIGLYQFIIDNTFSVIYSLDKNSSVDLTYNALLITKEIKNKNFIKKLSEIIIDKIEDTLISSSDFNHPKIYEMSLLVSSLLKTPLKEAVFIPKIQANHLINVMHWYDTKLKERVLLITNKRYIVLVLTSSISIGAQIFIVLYFLIRQSTPTSLAAASLIAGSIWFMLDKLMKKPPIEK